MNIFICLCKKSHIHCGEMETGYGHVKVLHSTFCLVIVFKYDNMLSYCQL
uniref:Uncharacterized protein n=1 Tax=Manihot esculenta TaxID=3983 RepID=A0A2C9UPB2_MANES